jgi:hypothetical protein
MNYTLIGLYGVYLVFVGLSGKTAQLSAEFKSDAKGFAPWLIAIIILRTMYSSDALKPVVAPFAGLAILTFFLQNYDTLASQVNEIAGANYFPTKTK